MFGRERPPSITEPPSEEPEKARSEASTEEEIPVESKGFINRIRELVNSKVQESRLPTKEGLGYESTMGIYGGKLASDTEGRMVYDTRGLWSRVDQWGDRILRSFDEHHARWPWKIARSRPMQFVKILPFIVDSKRYRGTPEMTMDNIERLGLEDYYGPHEWGIEVKQPEVFTHAIGLQDVFRQDLIQSPVLDKIDRFEAEAAAVRYMKELHDTAGGIAEGNVYTFLFEKAEGGKAEKPFLMIPTETYNPEKHISLIEQKATDLLDFLASVGMEEWRRSQSLKNEDERWASMKKAWDVALSSYGDKKVISMVASYVRRGRLTLPGDIEALEFETSSTYRQSRKVFAAHNTQRLTAVADISAELRRRIIGACEQYTKESE